MRSNILNILVDFYEKANTNIYNRNEITTDILDIELFRGEILSPLMFNHFINDIDNLDRYFKETGYRGVSFNSMS